MSKISSEASEIEKEKKYITKTVIKDDGTYGDELVEVTEADLHANGNQNSIEYRLRRFCVESFDFCYNLSKCLAKLLCNLDLLETVNKKAVASTVIYVCEMLKYHQSNGANESHLIKRTSDVIRLITSGQYTAGNVFIYRHLLQSEQANIEGLKP
jgi:hypothetical protein